MTNTTDAVPETLADVLADILTRLDRLEGDRAGVWVAYYSDHSGMSVFPTEIEALRHARERNMDAVEFQPWGEVW